MSKQAKLIFVIVNILFLDENFRFLTYLERKLNFFINK